MSSVRPSVTLVDCDHIGWNSSKIISPLVSLGCSLFATPTWRVCSKGNTPKFGPKVTPPLVDLSDSSFLLQYFDTVRWLGLLTCKNRLPYNLYCVGWDVKHCLINQSVSILSDSGRRSRPFMGIAINIHLLHDYKNYYAFESSDRSVET